MRLLRPHRKFEDLRNRALEGPLPAIEAASFSQHAERCGRCKEALRQGQAIRTALGALPDRPAPRSFRLSEEDVAGLSPVPLAVAPRVERPALPAAVRWGAFGMGAAAAAALGLVTVVNLGGSNDATSKTAAKAGAGEHSRAAGAEAAVPGGGGPGVAPAQATTTEDSIQTPRATGPTPDIEAQGSPVATPTPTIAALRTPGVPLTGDGTPASDPAGAPPSASGNAAPSLAGNGDDRPGWLTPLQIGLALIAGAGIAAGALAWRQAQRR